MRLVLLLGVLLFAVAGLAASPAVSVAADCGTSLQARVDAAPSGSTLDLKGCSYTGTAVVSRPLTLLNGKLTSPTNDRWATSLSVDSDNVKIQGWTFIGGGQVISIFGRQNVSILSNSMKGGQTGSAIAIWGAARYIVIKGNKITQTKTIQVSPIMGRASEDCSTLARDVKIRNNVIDQGPGTSNVNTTTGWFGIELKCFRNVLIDGNSIKGGHVLVSLPDSNKVTVTKNSFDMRGFAYWAVEVAHANDVRIDTNTVIGDGPNSDDHAFSTNSGSLRTTVVYNSVSDVRTLFDGGLYAVITDNCLTSVANVIEFGSPTNIVARNGPC